ncbi:MAG TPA: winged helix-turn-helix transcriptional regulator [Myxococcota bacterium]|nr:winged helix-turn-helix transcriptional regulator [Myxococcota bacterium]
MQAVLPRARRAADGAAAIPRPGGIFDPVARALEAIGDRWTLVLVRQLLAAPRGFQELRQRTGIAPRVLSSRLRELTSKGFVETKASGPRSLYALRDEGRALEPVVVALGRWWIQRGLEALGIDPHRFNATSAQSVLEALPFMLREDRARGVDLVFEIRLEGDGGGVWTLRIHDGACHVRPGFAERADVRYTADARVWCGVALGLVSAREMHRQGLMSKEGGRQALDHYFHQVPHPGRAKEKAP